MSYVARLISAVLLAGTSAPAAEASSQPSAAELDFFESKVRPVLAEHCYKCHSARSEKLKGGLLVDSRAALISGGDSGGSIVPGELDKGTLIEAIRYKNDDTAMPPKGKLPDTVIKDLETWVKMGAPWPAEAAAPVAGGQGKKPDYEEIRREHWSYQPVRDVALPAVRDAAWARNDIDRFILAALEAKGLSPAADADRATLARRVYFDLIGLPPTPEQIDAFVNDAAPAAYERLVDALLASPHFGERWGRHWLDVARYAESLTLRGFVLRDAWRYRDYVIDTFNRDRPFDAFLQEQIAGDLMPAASPEDRRRQMTGTTFLAMGNTNLEEQDKKQLRMDVVDEQIDTIGKAFLGQTIGCARCHDHKFDPIPTADYYAMAGILGNAKTLEHANVSKWLEVPLPESPEREAELLRHEAAVASLKAQIKDLRVAVAKANAKDADKLPKGGRATVVAVKDLPGVVVDDAAARRSGEWKHSTSVATHIGAGYVHDEAKGKGEKTLTFQPDLPRAGRYEVRLAYTPGDSRAKNVPVTVFSEDDEKMLLIDQSAPPPIDGRFVSLGVYPFERNGQGYVLVSNEGTKGHVIADAVQFLPVEDVAAAQIAASTQSPVASGANVSNSAGLAAAIQNPQSKIQNSADAGRIGRLEAELKSLIEKGPQRQTILSVVEEKEIADARIHIRGLPHNLGPSVPRGFLTCVTVASPPPVPADASGRLQLGQWLARPDNPLPARVMTNRAWHWLMGQGIVRTVDNFGTTGETPSHPALLDHLAARFAADGWSVKRLVRQIVLSRTYQLSTAANPAAVAIDPENRLRWRMDRRRLDAECIRDAMLAASGSLDRTPGGLTYLPAIATDYNYRHADVRRSVYSPVFRNALPEAFEAFDFADPSMVVGRRTVSTVAPQALYLMNHPFPQERAKAMAAALLADGGLDDPGRAMRAYRLTLGRPPTDAEGAVVTRFLAGADNSAAREAAWAQVIHALFASTDFRYVN